MPLRDLDLTDSCFGDFWLEVSCFGGSRSGDLKDHSVTLQ